MILQVWYMYIAKKKFTSILMPCFRFTYKKNQENLPKFNIMNEVLECAFLRLVIDFWIFDNYITEISTRGFVS